MCVVYRIPLPITAACAFGLIFMIMAFNKMMKLKQKHRNKPIRIDYGISINVINHVHQRCVFSFVLRFNHIFASLLSSFFFSVSITTNKIINLIEYIKSFNHSRYLPFVPKNKSILKLRSLLINL